MADSLINLKLDAMLAVLDALAKAFALGRADPRIAAYLAAQPDKDAAEVLHALFTKALHEAASPPLRQQLREEAVDAHASKLIEDAAINRALKLIEELLANGYSLERPSELMPAVSERLKTQPALALVSAWGKTA